MDFTGGSSNERGLQLLVVAADGVLGKFLDHVVGRPEEDPRVRPAEHGRVVVRVSRCHDPEVERSERLDGSTLSIVDAELVARDSIFAVDLEVVAEETRIAELPHQWLCKRIEGIGKNDHLGTGAKPIEEVRGAVERTHAVDDLLDLTERDSMFIENPQSVLHELVIVGLVPRRPAERFDAGALGDVDPDFRDENALEVQTRDHARTLAEPLHRDNRWRTVRGLVALLLVAVVGLGCSSRRLRVGTSGDYPPFSVAEESGARHGFDISVARAYAQDRGLQLEIVPFTWPTLEQQLLEGDFDVAMSGVTVRGDRLAKAPMTTSVARAEAVVAVKEGRIPGDLDRPGVVIAVNRGGHLEKVARGRFAKATIQAVDDNQSLPDLLADNRVHAVVTDSLEANTFETEVRVAEVLARDRKAYWVSPDRPDLALDMNRWIGARAASRWFENERIVWLDDPQTPVLPADEATLIDHLGQRLMLMPLVAEVKRAKNLPVEVPGREAAIEEKARAAAERVGLDPSSYLALVRAQIEAAKAVQRGVLARGTSVDVSRLPDLEGDIRPAIDRIDVAIRSTLLWVAPVGASEDEIVEALRKDAPVPGLDEATLRGVARAVRAIPSVGGRTARRKEISGADESCGRASGTGDRATRRALDSGGSYLAFRRRTALRVEQTAHEAAGGTDRPPQKREGDGVVRRDSHLRK